MERRTAALEAFYLQSRAWLDNRDAANATMIDSDNVLLLRPARTDRGFNLHGMRRSHIGQGDVPSSFVGLTVFMLRGPANSGAIGSFEAYMLPQLDRIADRTAYFVTEERPNDFPRLPVREGEWAFVAAGICPTSDAVEEWMRITQADGLPEELRSLAIGSERLRLEPALRCLFR